MQWTIVPHAPGGVEIVLQGRWTARLVIPLKEWRTPEGKAQVAAWAVTLARIPGSGIPATLAENLSSFCLRSRQNGESTRDDRAID